MVVPAEGEAVGYSGPHGVGAAFLLLDSYVATDRFTKTVPLFRAYPVPGVF